MRMQTKRVRVAHVTTTINHTHMRTHKLVLLLVASFRSHFTQSTVSRPTPRLKSTRIPMLISRQTERDGRSDRTALSIRLFVCLFVCLLDARDRTDVTFQRIDAAWKKDPPFLFFVRIHPPGGSRARTTRVSKIRLLDSTREKARRR